MKLAILALLSSAVILLGCGSTPAPRPATRPSTAPALAPITRPVVTPLTVPSHRVSDPELKTLPGGQSYAFVTRKVSFRTLQKEIESGMADLFKDPAVGPNLAGPSVFIYRGATKELDKPFDLDVGFIVNADTKVTSAKLRQLPAMKSLMVTYSGPMSAIDKAYDRVFPELQRRGLQRTGEVRETYTQWGGAESGSNEVEIAVGVE